MKKLVTKPMTKATITKIVAADTSKSAKMKKLFDGGVEYKEIASLLKVRYNFVYNVLDKYRIQTGAKVEKSARSGGEQKAKILKGLEEGKTIAQISKDTGILYNYVWQVVAKHRKEQEAK